VFVDIDLLLLGPALIFAAMHALFGFCAELGNENGLLWEGPFDVIGVFGMHVIPTDVLVLTDDVESIGERVVLHHFIAFGVRADESGGDGTGGIEPAGFVGEVGQKLGASGVVGCLVGDGPENDRGFIAVAADHFAKHVRSFGVNRWLVEGDMLPERNLRPDHDAVAVGGALHTLVVGVMTEADEVGVEVFEKGEDIVDVLLVIDASGAVGGFGMHVRALQEDSFAVEEDAGPVDADVAEADIVREFVLTGGEFDLVEFWRFRRPEIEFAGLQVEGCSAFCICLDGGADAGLGYTQGDRGSGGGTFDMDVAGEGAGIGGGEGAFALEVDVVVVDELRGKSNEGDIAGEAAVVEPIDANGGDAIDLAGGVHRDNDEVVTGLQGGGDFAVEGGEAALVVADALLVYPDEGLIVCSADMEEGARVGFGLEVEVVLIPDDPLKAEKRRVLSVPVAGDFECGSSGEVIFFVVRATVDIGVGIQSISVVADLARRLVQTFCGRLIN